MRWRRKGNNQIIRNVFFIFILVGKLIVSVILLVLVIEGIVGVSKGLFDPFEIENFFQKVFNGLRIDLRVLGGEEVEKGSFAGEGI